MKIAILADDFPPNTFGGAGIIAFQQAKELLNRGNEVVVITTTSDKKQPYKSLYDDLIVYSLFTNFSKRYRSYISLYNPNTVSKINKIFLDFKPDVVHAHNIHEKISYSALSVASAHTKKIFITAHDVMLFHYSKLYPKKRRSGGAVTTDYRVSFFSQAYYFRLAWNPIRNLVIRWHIRNVSIIFAVSKALADALNQNGINNVTVLYNGIDSDDFFISEADKQAMRGKYSLDGSKVLFFAGRMSSAKGGDVILQLVKKIVPHFPQVRFVFAGREDSYTDIFLKQAESLGIQKNIIFLGWIDRQTVKIGYAVSDVVLTLSKYLDPFPTTNLEAMASKKPVIGTNLGGTSEVVLDQKTGYIVDPYNIESIVQSTQALLENETLATMFGAAGYDRVVSEFSLKKQISILLEFYENS